MPDLRHRTILIVEDEYLLACELETELRDAGADVLGPVGSLEDALDLVASGRSIDGAILDVNLQGSTVFPVADMLMDRQVPFVFTTGYDDLVLPTRLRQATRYEKPLDIAVVLRRMRQMIDG
ncbi:response regulator [Paracoccus liaowanqingii]|uniref:Response regulator n=1 Tax=Paracoccus liaowanqingii TaxID=2560053 RepID=A0A4Z1C5T2_9RHOB|nr:response regulator [Paracoccus liaowanqingii]TGN49288.1 response regulator [Paracoccus liaowanqingii]